MENNKALFADGFESALIGEGFQFDKPLAVYDYDKCLSILMERDGMSEDDAEDFMEFNVVNAYVGENTPVFINLKN